MCAMQTFWNIVQLSDAPNRPLYQYQIDDETKPLMIFKTFFEDDGYQKGIDLWK